MNIWIPCSFNRRKNVSDAFETWRALVPARCSAFLVQFDIIHLPRLFRFLQRTFAQLISVLRAPKSKEGYAAIGGGSPLRKITDEHVSGLSIILIASALKSALEAKEFSANRTMLPCGTGIHSLRKLSIRQVTHLSLLIILINDEGQNRNCAAFLLKNKKTYLLDCSAEARADERPFGRRNRARDKHPAAQGLLLGLIRSSTVKRANPARTDGPSAGSPKTAQGLDNRLGLEVLVGILEIAGCARK
ncbi:ferrochelatase, partial [Striga asiatica]